MNKLDRPFLLGENIYLRPLDMDDVNDNYLHWINDEEVIQYLATTFPITREGLENFVKSILNNHNFSFFAIIEKETNNHIGNVKLGPIDWINRTANFGLMLGEKSSWGKGYANEAFNLLLKYAFKTLNLHKLWDIAADSHIASIKSLEKVGIKIEAKLSQHSFKNGKYEDAVVVSITSDEYFMKESRTTKNSI